MTDLTWCPTLEALYREGGAVDSEGVRRQPGGLSTPNNLLIIRSLMMALKPKRTLEVGLAAGGSALTFAASHRDLGHLPSSQHTAIDPYQRVWHHLGKTLIERESLTQFTRVIEEPSCLALPDLMRSGERFQIAYIDGSHVFHEAMLDFYYTRHLLDIGGIVLFDDCATAEIRRLIHHISRHIRSVKPFDLSPFHPQKAKRRIAALIGKAQCVAFQKIADPQKDESWVWED